MKRAPTLSIRDLQTRVAEMVSKAIILRPEVPAEILADEVIDEAEPDLIRQFGHMLMVGFVARGIRSERVKQRRSKIPEMFIHLPFRVRLPSGLVVPLDQMTYTQAREYYFALGRRLDHRKSNDVRRAEAKALMDALYKPAKKDRGITAGEALGFDFGE